MYKGKNMLVGDSKEAEYEFFCNVMIQRDGFIEEVFEEFPVLLRCVAECIRNQASYYLEILTFLRKTEMRFEKYQGSMRQLRLLKTSREIWVIHIIMVGEL